MSRIGKRPIPLPKSVTVDIKGQEITVKGSKGTLSRVLPSGVKITQEDNTILVVPDNNSRTSRERHGLVRTLIANMVEGVSNGFQKRLQIQGVGYRAQAQGSQLTLNVGYSKPVEITMPEGIKVAVEERQTEVVIDGIDKELVGNIAATIRAVRPPEVYKGKGIRYKGEMIRLKAGKTGKK